MSTAPAPHSAGAGQPLTSNREIRIVSHSNLFYWWPVWAVGFLMALLTLWDGHLLAIVPPKTELAHKADAIKKEKGKKEEWEDRDILVAPENKTMEKPGLLMAKNKNLGVVFTIILLLVIAITNIPLRGLWSVIVIVVIVFMSIILAITDKWAIILETFFRLDIHINLAGYIVISTVLLIIWLITLFLFDQQIYMIFTPGQLRVRLEIGEGETVYDTQGMTVQKQRSDLFRHWILGLGSGDLIVKTSGAQAHHFDLPNVLFVGKKVKEIEQMLRSRPVVAGQG